MTLKLNHLHLKTKDPEKTAKFYVDTLGATIVNQNPDGGYRPNCLIKNLTEIDSLPHLRNLIEISLPIDRMEGKDEVDDERKKVGGEGDGGALPKGEEKGEGRDAGRTDRAY